MDALICIHKEYSKAEGFAGKYEGKRMISLKRKAYGIIKENIVTCRYAPGEFLNESQLMEEIGTSRTPIREALSKLEQEKFVRIVSKKGVMVSELTLKEIGDVYQVRLMLEPQMVRQWGGNIPVDALEACRFKLLSYSPEMDVTQRNEIDDCLHRLIFDSCPNAYFQQWMTHIYCQNQRIRVVTGQLGQLMQENNEGHLRITEKLLMSDYEAAADLLTSHLELAKKNTFDNLLKSNPTYGR